MNTRYLIGKPSSRIVVIRYQWSRRWRIRHDHVRLGRIALWWQR